MSYLTNKVAIITGAGRGIGRDIGLLLAKEGAKVVVNDIGGSGDGIGIDSTVADNVVQEIKANGGEAIANYDSVVEIQNAEKMVKTAIDHFGRLDIVINNAGILRNNLIFKMSEKDWDAVVAVHLKGTFNLTRAASPYFKEQKNGRFINFTSSSGLIGNLAQANYAASKLGIIGLTKSTALDMSRYHVTANAIAPFAWSRLFAAIPQDAETYDKKVGWAKEVLPESIAPIVAYLSSEDAADVTGQIFGVRGKEVILFSQPRPKRSIYSSEDWTIESLKKMKQSFKSDFTPLETSGEVFPYKPLI